MSDRDYVLGTNDEEIARLGLQHRLWRDRVLDGWSRAGFGPGMRIMDVGAGPGFATVDLAEIAGPTGSVVAVERSGRSLGRLRAEVEQRGLSHVAIHEADLDELEQLPVSGIDGVWCLMDSLVRAPTSTTRGQADRVAPAWWCRSPSRVRQLCELASDAPRAIVRGVCAGGDGELARLGARMVTPMVLEIVVKAG